MPPVNDNSTVISFLPVAIDEDKPGLIPGKYQIAAVSDPMKDYNILNVIRAEFPVYLDENRPSLRVPSPSDIVADSICRDYRTAIGYVENGIAEPGLFWIAGQWLKADILDKNKDLFTHRRQMQVEWFKRLVDAADDEWAKNRMRRMISTLQKLACKAIGLEREWMTDIEVAHNLSLVKCKFCRADIDPEALVCPHCRSVLDVKKFELAQGKQA